jgi:hypothetical protein
MHWFLLVLLAVGTSGLAYLYTYQLPYYRFEFNVMRACTFWVLAWASLCLIITEYSGASAANAPIDHVRDWVFGTGDRWVTMGIPSDGSYGIPEDVMFGYPVTCADGEYHIVQGLEIDEFSRSRINITLAELEEERAGVAHLLS